MSRRLICRICSSLGLLAWAAGLAACTGSAIPTASPSTFPTVTITPAASRMSTSASPSPAPSQTSTPLPTLDLAATVQVNSTSSVRSSHVSPDGFWWARVFTYDCTALGSDNYAYDALSIRNQRRGGEQIVFTQLIICGGLGAAGLEGLYWSPTSRFFYFTDAASGVPDGCGYWQPPLLRVDITDWSVTSMGAGPVSPDGYRLASWQDGELVVWYVSGVRVGSAPPPVSGMLPGPIAWSPDSRSVSYLLSQSACPLGLTYLVRMNLTDFQPVPYLASQDPSFVSLNWDMPYRVILGDEAGTYWTYNFINGSLDHYTP